MKTEKLAAMPKNRLPDAYFADNTRGMQDSIATLYCAWIPRIQAALQDYFPSIQSAESLERLLAVPPGAIDADAVREMISEPNLLYVNRPGKLLRPFLTALLLETFGVPYAGHLGILAMIELLEAASISLNDIWDDSLFRRGGYCTHIQYDREIAHVAGLAGCLYGYEFLMEGRSALPEDVVHALNKGFAYEDGQWFLGDIVETVWPVIGRDHLPQDVFFQEVVSRCAFLSFRGPARIAGILARVAPENLRRLESFGMWIGLAYHLRGDNLNSIPQSNSWGKIPYEDITAGRRSLLTSYALSRADTADRAEMLDILNARTKDKSRILRFVRLLERYEAPAYCESLALEAIARAEAALNEVPMAPVHRGLLKAYSDFMINRTK